MQSHLTDYDATYATFSWRDWEQAFSFHATGKVNYAYEVSDVHVQRGNGDRPAIVCCTAGGTMMQITFRELAERTTTIAGNLRSLGVRPGDRFGLFATKSIEYVTMLLGIIKCGAIAVPLFEAFGADAIADRLNDCSARWLYMNAKLTRALVPASIPSLQAVVTERAIDLPPGVRNLLVADLLKGSADPSAIQFGDLETGFIIHYTSGSTAKPKGILLAQRSMIGHLVTARYVLDLTPEDVYWNSGDPGWVTGMVYNFFAPLLLGVTAHLYAGPFHPMGWVQFMEQIGVTVWYSTPTAFRLLRYYNVPLNRERVPTLRHIVSAGEPLNPSLIDWTMANLGIPIHDSWYMTENGHQLINNYRCVPIKKGSMGRCLPGIRAAIIDTHGTELPRGQVGRLAVQTPWPGLMKTVWNNPEKFTSYFEDGWYISGDTAYQDADGYFWFQGRDDDMLKCAGERISPFEIESALVAHPAVAEAAVIGKPHDLYGNVVHAFVILAPPAQPSEDLTVALMQHVKERRAVHEVPRAIEFVATLPKTRSGKIMRRVLRARAMGLPEGDLSTMDTEMNPAAAAVSAPRS